MYVLSETVFEDWVTFQYHVGISVTARW